MPSNSTKASLEKSCQHYQEMLTEGEEGRASVNYLKLRGVTKETAAYFRLGLVKDPLPESGHDFMTGRLAIPYITQTGIVQMRFRAIPYDGIPGNPEPSPKMLSEADAGTTLYNVTALSPQNQTIYLCEGESDTWAAHQSNLPTIGVPGARAWKRVFSRAFKFRRLVILADNDDHGEGLEFAQKVQADVRGTRIVLMPKEYDVSKFVNEEGEQALRSLVGVE